MYLDIYGTIETETQTQKVANEKYELYWEGIVFFPGVNEGELTMKTLLELLDICSTEEAVLNSIKKLRGNWALFLLDISKKRWIACTDHSHQSNFYFTEESIAHSFLRLRKEQTNKSCVEEDSILSYLYCGHCYTESIFYKSIKRLDYHDYLVVDEQRIRIKSKLLKDVFARNEIVDDFVQNLGNLFSSLRNHKLCLDLSGGTDTRALLIALDHLGYEFDVATYGDRQYSEVQIALKVANAVQKDLKFGEFSNSDMHLNDLYKAWIACDGLGMALDSYKFETWRKQFGYSLVICGAGGELYKDGGWYRAALINLMRRKGLERTIQLLINSGEMLWEGIPLEELENILAPHHRGKIQRFLSEIFSRLFEENRYFPLLEASDRIFFNYSTNRPGGTGNSVIPRYLPLYEPDMVGVGVKQPIWQRLNHNLYRNSCGKLNIKAASIETDRIGLTLSNHFYDIIKDFAKYFRVYVAKSFGFETTAFKTVNANANIVFRYVAEHPDLSNGVRNLQERGFLNPKISFRSLTPNIAYRIVAIHYLLESS